MNEQNPYQSPETELFESAVAANRAVEAPALALGSADATPAVSTVHTVLPRYIAAILDNFIAWTLGVVAAKIY